MTPIELKELRESFDFTQKQMGDILGIHPNALQNMEYGKNPIPKYIKNYALSLTALNENLLFRKHIIMIGVELCSTCDGSGQIPSPDGYAICKDCH